MCYAIGQCCEVVSALFSEMNVVRLREGQDSPVGSCGSGIPVGSMEFP